MKNRNLADDAKNGKDDEDDEDDATDDTKFFLSSPLGNFFY